LRRRAAVDTYNILVVDDEVNSLNALRRTLRHEYNVFTATTGQDALDIMQQNDIALIIADHRMPGMAGVELLEEILQKHPDTIRIILTAYTDEKLLMDAINVGRVHKYIEKPWEPEGMRATVKEGIEAYEEARAAKISERKRIGQILVDYGMISESQLQTALELQRGEAQHERRKLGEILVDLKYTDEESVFLCYAMQLGMPYISLSQLAISPEVARLMPSELAHRHAIVPVYKIGRVLVVATSEPLADTVQSEIEEKTGCKINTACASLRDIKAALQQCYSKQVSIEGEPQHEGSR
jgi:CheY-like chemotaxis protein